MGIKTVCKEIYGAVTAFAKYVYPEIVGENLPDRE
jgi:hypothetical protein